MRSKRVRPNEYMCINGDMHIVDNGQFVLKDDYERLLRKYKKLIKLAHVRGLFKQKSHEMRGVVLW